MTAQNVIELIGLAIGGGGGAQLVSKLTRLAVAVESLVESHKKLTETVADHEKRLGKGGL